MTYKFNYSIHKCLSDDVSKDINGFIHATDMNDAVNQILALCPSGWHYHHIQKEVN